MSQAAGKKDKNAPIIIPECRSFISKQSTRTKAVHEEIEIKYFYSGSSTLLIGNEVIEAFAGDIVIINSFEFHTTVNTGAELGRYHTIMVPLDYFSESGEHTLNLRTKLQVCGCSFVNLIRNEPEAKRLILGIVEEYVKKDEAYNSQIRGLMTEFFVYLLRNRTKVCETENSGSNPFRSYTLIEPALRRIRDNYAAEITVEELAAHCNMSKYYFCHVFKSVIGKSSMEYLREYRLRIANIMLKLSDSNITFISKQCGFEDVNYFCRSYKKYYGAPPGKHRKSYN